MKKISCENKSLFRQNAKEHLSKVHNAYKRDKVISKQLLEVIDQIKPRSILMYIPLGIEANITHVIEKCRRKYRVFVPFMQGISFKMVKYRLPLYTKRFNLKEPKNSLVRHNAIDLAIVPVIGVDGALRRIGFGKGMYDRFFHSLSSKPIVIFVQRSMCMTPMLIGEEHDIAANIYLTPYQIISQRGYHDIRITSGRSNSSKRRCGVFHRKKDGSGKL